MRTHITKVLRLYLLLLGLIILILKTNTEIKADINREGGDLTYQTSATNSGGAGWKFSTVGWNYHVTTNQGYKKVYIPLNEMQSSGDMTMYYRISWETIVEKAGFKVDDTKYIIIDADACVEFHYKRNDGTIDYSKGLEYANTKTEADRLAKKHFGHNWTYYGYYFQSIQWANFYLTVNKGTGVSSTYGGGRYYAPDQIAHYGGTASAGYELEYPQGQDIKMDSHKTVTVNAKLKQYTLSFDYRNPLRNGGQIFGNELKSKSVTYMSKIGGLPLPSASGFRFDGWYTSTAYKERWTENTIYKYATNVTLYAKWVDNSPPELTVGGGVPDSNNSVIEYDWVNHSVDLDIEVYDDGLIDSLKIYKYSKYNEDQYSEINWNSIEYKKDDYGNVIGARGKYTVRQDYDEGITKYLIESRDKAGNKAQKNIIVKIDVNAPQGDTIITSDGYTVRVSIKNIIEALHGTSVDDGDKAQASGCKNAWVVIEDATEDANKVPGINYEAFRQTVNLSRLTDEIKSGASYSGTIPLTDDLCYTSDKINVLVYIEDYAGNRRKLKEENYASFYLTGYVERGAGPAVTWARGDGGYVNFYTGSYVDSVEIKFPDEWVAIDPTLTAMYDFTTAKRIYNATYEMGGLTKTDEPTAFITPIASTDGTYNVVITAYKNGRMKSVNVPITTNGNVLENIRSRLRVHN